MTIGDRIKEARKSKGLTQEELAKLLGVTFAMIGQYERGERNPKKETLQRIADALGVSVGELMPDSVMRDRDGVKYSGSIIPQSEIDEDDLFDYHNNNWLERVKEALQPLPEKDRQDILEFIEFKLNKAMQLPEREKAAFFRGVQRGIADGMKDGKSGDGKK